MTTATTRSTAKPATTINGGIGNDSIFGGDGVDTVHGNDGADRIFGESGNDQLYGDAGNDVIDGGANADTIRGGDGDDVLDGDLANDTLYGENGEDVLIGGAGTNTSDGGPGTDACTGTSCELRAMTPSGCTQNAQCSSGKHCVVDIGLCLGCLADNDNDGVCNSADGCPNDANKSAPGICGCGISDADTDHDGTHGVEGLTRIGGGLFVSDNPVLTDLAGFGNVTSLGVTNPNEWGAFYVAHNPELPMCWVDAIAQRTGVTCEQRPPYNSEVDECIGNDGSGSSQ